MLKRISTENLRQGMYVHDFCGSWMDHPFWRAKFVLKDPKDLARIQAAAIEEVWIDTSKGLDVAAGVRSVSRAEADFQVDTDFGMLDSLPSLVLDPPRKPPPARRERDRAPASMHSELQAAASICVESKQAVASMFREARMGKAVNSENARSLVEEISDSVTRNPGALISLARLKTADDYTYMHSVAVCALMVALARQLDLPEDQVHEAGMAGLLHDIGKMAMPLDVLNKPGKLSDDEYAIMRSHPERGHAMLLAAQTAVSDAVLDVCLHHHEKVDGTGYPHRLAGEEISLLARMGAICDVYDAITSNRPYKTAWDASGSLARMAQWQGHFDTQLLHAFVRTVGIYPLGSLVRLQSGRLGVVIEHHPQQLTAPRLKLFYSVRTRAAIPAQELDLSNPQCGDRIVGREDPAAWGFNNLDELWT